MMGRAKAAATTLGFTPELVDAIEKHVGYAKTYKLLAEMGGKLGEDNLRTVDSKTPGFEGKMTPDEAKAEWGAKQLDPNFMAALKDKTHPGHKGAQEVQNRLFKVMYPS
jgi:lysophospholipase L1-like esterase